MSVKSISIDISKARRDHEPSIAPSSHPSASVANDVSSSPVNQDLFDTDDSGGGGGSSSSGSEHTDDEEAEYSHEEQEDNLESEAEKGAQEPEVFRGEPDEEDEEGEDEDEDEENDQAINPSDSASHLDTLSSRGVSPAARVAHYPRPRKVIYRNHSPHGPVPPSAPSPELLREAPPRRSEASRRIRRERDRHQDDHPYRARFQHRRRPPQGHAETVDQEIYYDEAGVPYGPPPRGDYDGYYVQSGGHYPQSVLSDHHHAPPRPAHRAAYHAQHAQAMMQYGGPDPFAYHQQHHQQHPSNITSPVYPGMPHPQGYFPPGPSGGPQMAVMPYGQMPQYAYPGYPGYPMPVPAPASPPTTDRSDSSKDFEAQLKLMAEQMKAMEEERVKKEIAREKAEEEKRAKAEEEAARAAAAKAFEEGKQKAASEAKSAAEKEAEEKLKKATEEHDKAIKEAKEAQEKAEKAAEAAKEESAKLKPPDDAGMSPIKFKDAVGRKFSFPWALCKNWEHQMEADSSKGMEKLIRQAFLHVAVIGEHVQEGHYDLIGPNGEIILPGVWDTTVKPDWSITMHMWPIPEEKKKEEAAPGAAPAPKTSKKKGRAAAAAPPPPPAGAAAAETPPGVTVVKDEPKKSKRRDPTPLLWFAGGGVRRRTPG